MTLQDLVIPNPNEQKKYTAIIEAAFKVFARDGLHKGKIADIAKEAGVGKGTVYEYFRSKEEIFTAILNQFFDLIQVGLDEVNRLEIPADQKVRMLLELNLDWFKTTTTEEALIVTEIWAQGLRSFYIGQPDDALILRYRKIQSTMMSILNQGVTDGVFRAVESETLAILLMATLDGIGLHFLMNQSLDIEKLKRVTIRAFLEGILVRPNSTQPQE
ncbi:MAG: hypothetical protein CO167_09440 [Candidatus Marinimicrobia bacterium CG_4_9_14_3_um_filter_48_9]|nr:MAG: hypothetical protein CO167_09440 [Candidatus Marinimicrobia bacterium CG_4_9_14_3_um_filter_48_9]